MGKTILSPSHLSRIFASSKKNRVKSPPETIRPPIATSKPDKTMEASGSGGSGTRSNLLPLSEVVSDCVKRWFQDTLKEARAGDSAMQVLVGQMYYNGYGVTINVHKGRAWINKASKVRASVWKVSEKRPGYNASDSDSDNTKVEAE